MIKQSTQGINGRQITFSYGGSPDLRPLVFLHGYGTFPPRYTATLEALTRTHHILAPHIGATSLEEFAQYVDAFAREYTSIPYDLVGHSTGAGAALLVASRARVRSLAYVNGPLPHSNSTIGLLFGGARLAAYRLMGRRGDGVFTARQAAARTREILMYLGNNPRQGLRTIGRLARFETNGLHVSAPVLVLHTAHDEFFPPNDAGFAELRAACPDLTLRVIGTDDPTISHEWFLYRPGLARQELQRFYDGIKE